LVHLHLGCCLSGNSHHVLATVECNILIISALNSES
jgi:hypothetical protein